MDSTLKAARRRSIPSVEKAVQALPPLGIPRPLAVQIVREELAAIRAGAEIPGHEEIMERLHSAVAAAQRSRLQPVINATGITLHTNFGRAPLSRAALEAVATLAGGYSNLEYDLHSGERGGRGAYLERCLALLCDAEAATLVNNCASALLLILRHFTAVKREVIISRGELIQIGGGFRIPEILEASGARLREVGTTNRTTIEDYARAVGGDSGLILKVHRSNFYMGGFVESPHPEDLAALSRASGVPFIEDLGSGAVCDFLPVSETDREPSPAEVLRRGADLVCFSGDKLFGGPQAGIIAGRGDLVRALKKDPLFRALRCDKLVFAALQATAELHLNGAALTDIPALALLTSSAAELRPRAEAIVTALAGESVRLEIGETRAEAGGGTLPRTRIPSIALHLQPLRGSLEQLAARLRTGSPPVVGYLSDDRLALDLRTVLPSQDSQIVDAIRQALHAE